ncbi:SPOR domain-containing protein (plasmid) [Aliirhizobium terrae]|uniref:SPOR domain-containing protein n=1 Tax=Terrirhizobium terrae TaxID=2926709 RepID=UPI002574EC39|nr:SPOR domain-containing protein [Rhizobium sp. CC-CFT758]WJH38190.1 SPOR domain-containing protein [Rhizobium sp. CC-CFT758]
MPTNQGWSVQIGAFPDKQAAAQFLARAKQVLSPVLGTMTGLVMPHGSADARLYRARFVGFSDGDEAWAACAAMKKQDFKCWASK